MPLRRPRAVGLPCSLEQGRERQLERCLEMVDDLGDGSAPRPGGRADYLLKFKMPGTQTVTNDLGPGFLLNRLDLTPVR